MNDQETSALIEAAIGHAINGDAERAASSLRTIGEASDIGRMYGVCCAIATVATHVLKLLHGPGGDGASWAVSELAPGTLTAEPERAFAMRFLVAYTNGDSETCLALYNAAVQASDAEYVGSVIALLAAVAGLAKLALDEKQNGRLPS